MIKQIKMRQSFLLFLASITIATAQIQPTSSQKVDESLVAKKVMETNSLVKNIPLKNIGPSVMSGRVVDLAVNENNPTEYYVAYASGGLWYTNNNGNTFTPVMDETQTQNLGDIAVHWQSGTIWVGTGENNSSRSSITIKKGVYSFKLLMYYCHFNKRVYFIFCMNKVF